MYFEFFSNDKRLCSFIVWPVLCTLLASALSQIGYHDEQLAAILVHHGPEVIDRVLKRSLRCNKNLLIIVALKSRTLTDIQMHI